MSPIASASSAALPHASRIAPRFPAWVRSLRWLRRMAFLVHRWLGIALALLMLLWTLSGMVMMYVSFPETSAAERAAGLASLDLTHCCAPISIPAVQLESAAVEMTAGRPVLRWSSEEDGGSIDLTTGAPQRIGAVEAGQIAQLYLARTFGTAPKMTLAPGGLDQWTVYGAIRAKPLFKASFADARGTVLYVSAKNGKVVLDTSTRERFWNWLGAVPHWLYFTAIRQNAALWANIVIYASLLGTFLTVTGIYVGIRMYGRGKRKSPFRGIALWHHWTGLIFGLVTLTWVFSGFASMQPWGWLESEGPGDVPARLAGRPLKAADASALVAALIAHPPPDVVSAEATTEGGKAFAILVRPDGSRIRATLPDLALALPTAAELRALAVASRAAAVSEQGLITAGDAYHYAHHSTPAILPAWRVIYADADASRLYLDPRTAEPIDYIDGPTRQFRWWHSGLHRLDLPGVSHRPLWDAIMLVLLAGVALVCGLGAWMGWRRLRHDWLRMRHDQCMPRQTKETT